MNRYLLVLALVAYSFFFSSLASAGQTLENLGEGVSVGSVLSGRGSPDHVSAEEWACQNPGRLFLDESTPESWERVGFFTYALTHSFVICTQGRVFTIEQEYDKVFAWNFLVLCVGIVFMLISNVLMVLLRKTNSFPSMFFCSLSFPLMMLSAVSGGIPAFYVLITKVGGLIHVASAFVSVGAFFGIRSAPKYQWLYWACMVVFYPTAIASLLL